MVGRCPECGAAGADAPWCGTCGARLTDRADGTILAEDARTTEDEEPSGRRRVFLVVLVLGALAVVGLALGRDETPPADPAPDVSASADAVAVVPPGLESPGPVIGRQFAATAATVWERGDVVAAAPSTFVAAAGAGHVLVGDRLVETAASGSGDGQLGALPMPLLGSTIAPDGSWAIGEFGRLVLGSVGSSSTSSTAVTGPWVPEGVAVAWVEGEPVLPGTDGHLGRVAADGTIRWRTPEPVEPVGPQADGWVVAQRADGEVVAISVAHGTLVEVGPRPLAVHGDVAVLPDDGVVARDLGTGRVLWRRSVDTPTWRAVGEHLVAADAEGLVRIDPRTGTEEGRVSVGEAVAVAATDVVVLLDDDGLRGIGWDGTERWAVSAAADTLTSLDGERVAARRAQAGRATVTVLRASDGSVLVGASAPPRGDRWLTVADDVVAVVARSGESSVLDAQTGEDAAVPAPSLPRVDLTFPSGDTTVTVEVGAAHLRGREGEATVWSLPLGAPLVVPPVRTGTSLVVALANGDVAAVDPGRGEFRWRRDLGVLPTAVAGDGTMLLAGTDDGRVLRLDPDGRTVTSVQVGQGAVSSLVAGRPAFALLDDRVAALDLSGQ